MRRARILAATAEVVGERGVRGVTVAELSARAGISSATFYRVFGSCEECVLALHEQAMERMTGLTREAFARESCWSEGVVAGLAALLGFLDDEPLLARLCLVESLVLGEPALRRRAHALQALRPLLDAGPARARADAGGPAWGAEASMEAVAGVLRGRLVDGHAPPFTPLLGGLVDQLLGGAYRVSPQQLEQARRRARAIVREGRSPRPARVPLEPIPRWAENPNATRMRECLLWVAAHPRQSNQQVGAAIGIAHGGHVSALLNRLHERGVLAKRVGGPGKSNAWWPTPEGERIACILRVRR